MSIPNHRKYPTAAIIIVAYNRPSALERLLASLAQARYPSGDVPLLISIDQGDNAPVVQMASSFHWPHGPKELILHPVNLGLRRHILECGALSAKYGSVILLEDDLLVSPAFYEYACLAITAYGTQPKVAGMALYSYRITEGSLSAFLPLPGNDAYLMQLPCSWGQAWTDGQWQAFRDWHKVWDGEYRHIPTYIRYWSSHSWKKIYAEYMMDTGKYFLYPSLSFSSNTGEVGTNYKSKASHFEVPLQEHCEALQLPPFGECIRYDANFELEPQYLPPLGLGTPKGGVALDLHGSKTPADIPQEYVLTRQGCRNPIQRFARQSHPVELDALHPKEGRGLNLCRTKDFRLGWLYRWHNQRRPYFYTRTKFWNKIRMKIKGQG